MGAEGDDRLVVTDAVRIPRYELVTAFSAAGGPGGQHANKAATRVELTFDVTMSSAFTEAQRERVISKLGEKVRVVADDERSQLRNRMIARRAARCQTAGIASGATKPPGYKANERLTTAAFASKV